MNHDHKQHDDTGIDPQLAALYRATATETVPARLDDSVLNKAAATNISGKLKSWSSLTMRPLAISAMLIVSLAIVLQVNDPTSESMTDDFQHRPQADRPRETEVDSDAPSETQTAVSVSADYLRRHKNAPAAIQQQRSMTVPYPDANGESAAGAAALPEAAPVQRHCDSTRTETPDEWWECIHQLQKAGKLDQARSERDLLLRAHPESRRAN